MEDCECSSAPHAVYDLQHTHPVSLGYGVNVTCYLSRFPLGNNYISNIIISDIDFLSLVDK